MILRISRVAVRLWFWHSDEVVGFVAGRVFHVSCEAPKTRPVVDDLRRGDLTISVL
jgi:hypothetical protein